MIDRLIDWVTCRAVGLARRFDQHRVGLERGPIIPGGKSLCTLEANGAVFDVFDVVWRHTASIGTALFVLFFPADGAPPLKSRLYPLLLEAYSCAFMLFNPQDFQRVGPFAARVQRPKKR